MKIWLMNHYASDMFYNKAGRHYWFAKQLRDRGHEVTIFCANTFLNKPDVVDTEKKKSIIKMAEEISTPFVFVKTRPSVGNGVDRVRNMYGFYKNLLPVACNYAKNNYKPDVIVASSVHPLTMLAGLKIAKKLNVPCICEIRDLWPEAIFAFGKAKEKSILGKFLVKKEHMIYKKADALIFTKEGDTDYLKERGWTTEQGGDIDLAKCHYINNGIDIKAYIDQIENMILPDDDLVAGAFNVVYTGTIRPVNNVGNLLDTAKIIEKEGYNDIKFLIFGDGMQRAELEKRLTTENIINVKFKGMVEKKYIPYILSKSSVNMLNYAQNQYNWTRGNSSNKLFEYMASGKPIISTVKMGYSVINKYKCGVELEEDTPECLAKEIIRFYKMDAETYEEYGVNSKKGAKDFDFSCLTDRLMTVINEVTGNDA
ncbi:MAG: glycosyltransferase family 4 protein [Lachnospiraceae bacterium]|nr:glycosyltransferase family 4 protein [Lachnospiraceae bacterium]